MANATVKSTDFYTSDFLTKIRDVLMEKRKKLEHELSQFANKSSNVKDDYDSNFPQYGNKDDENAAEVAEYAANVSIEQDLEKILRDVTKSLQKIEDGGYGICKYCNKAIGEKRLLARPVSSACVECKKTIKQEA